MDIEDARWLMDLNTSQLAERKKNAERMKNNRKKLQETNPEAYQQLLAKEAENRERRMADPK